VERRRASRFRIRLPVLTEWTDHEGQVRYGGGFSRDVCLRGVFVVSSNLPPQAATITVTVVLPSVRAGSQELHLHSVGSVVRVEPGRAPAGYAINCDFEGIEDVIK
jgi:hypothetical protein